MARVSEVRGKDSSGIAYRDPNTLRIEVLKGPVRISRLLNSDSYKRFSRSYSNKSRVFAGIGHARLVTNGSQLNHVNNQPVVKNGLVGVHNGIIVNVDELWAKHTDLQREYEIDTEVFYALFEKYLMNTGDPLSAIQILDKEVFGTVATGFFPNNLEEFLLYTNNGSLYILTNYNDYLVFASERNILVRLRNKYGNLFKKDFELTQVMAGSGYRVLLNKFGVQSFKVPVDEVAIYKSRNVEPYSVNIETVKSYEQQQDEVVLDVNMYRHTANALQEASLLEYNLKSIDKLQRCKKCLLPKTFPYIKYDNTGVCNYCHNYVSQNRDKSLDELKSLVEPYRSQDGQPDCLVPFSGGRDSTFTLHLVKKELRLNPIAFTYDWGMVTDLARRNIARVCGKLGVENIIVAADIHWKRKNIKKNVKAWLKKPSLGMIPLFMVGDKYFFYYTDKVKKQNNINLNVWGINDLENTDFKTGFAGVPPEFDKERIYSLSIINQLKLFSFVGKNFITNPGYLNQSLLDTFGSFVSRYLIPKNDYYHIFDYYPWNEEEIERLIMEEYNWETAIDTDSTWRIGDGTASFYNYIYCTVAGFSEIDTFRSNQIREGLIEREEALQKLREENRPRYETIKWYLDIIGLDFTETIKRINTIPKLYGLLVYINFVI
ncbi:MAG: hypothetical protein WD431_17250 [Cyclobacteriaceae bacterium]